MFSPRRSRETIEQQRLALLTDSSYDTNKVVELRKLVTDVSDDEGVPMMDSCILLEQISPVSVRKSPRLQNFCVRRVERRRRSNSFALSDAGDLKHHDFLRSIEMPPLQEDEIEIEEIDMSNPDLETGLTDLEGLFGWDGIQLQSAAMLTTNQSSQETECSQPTHHESLNNFNLCELACDLARSNSADSFDFSMVDWRKTFCANGEKAAVGSDDPHDERPGQMMPESLLAYEIDWDETFNAVEEESFCPCSGANGFDGPIVSLIENTTQCATCHASLLGNANEKKNSSCGGLPLASGHWVSTAPALHASLHKEELELAVSYITMDWEQLSLDTYEQARDTSTPASSTATRKELLVARFGGMGASSVGTQRMGRRRESVSTMSYGTRGQPRSNSTSPFSRKERHRSKDCSQSMNTHAQVATMSATPESSQATFPNCPESPATRHRIRERRTSREDCGERSKFQEPNSPCSIAQISPQQVDPNNCQSPRLDISSQQRGKPNMKRTSRRSSRQSRFQDDLAVQLSTVQAHDRREQRVLRNRKPRDLHRYASASRDRKRQSNRGQGRAPGQASRNVITEEARAGLTFINC